MKIEQVGNTYAFFLKNDQNTVSLILLGEEVETREEEEIIVLFNNLVFLEYITGGIYHE